MNPTEDPKDTLAALRKLPTEVSLQQVEHMVAAFPLAMGAMAWLIHTLKFNLNTIVMTSSATLLVATSMYLFSGDAPTVTAALNELPAAPTVTVELPLVVEDAPAVVLDIPAKPQKPENTATVPAAVNDNAQGTTSPENGPTPPVVETPAEAPPAPEAASMVTRTNGQRQFDLRGFTQVHLTSSVDVVVEIGPFAVSATGDEDLLDKLDLRVDGNVLRISYQQTQGRNNRADNVSCLVRMPAVSGLKVSGSGQIAATTLPSTHALDLTILGSGQVVVGTIEQVDKLVMLVQGSGDINVDTIKEGKAVEMTALGSGDILLVRAERIASITALVQGSGGVYARNMDVQGTCDVSILGSGEATLAGSTDVLKVLLQGSGSAHLNQLKVRQSGQVELLGTGDVYLQSGSQLDLTTKGTGTIHTSGSAGNNRQ
jgi:hypothetical protein